ncbi:MAG: hypothetical protein EHM23_09390 [Acidobacteria bacterium]|nr:MAG: hypothetical protein EHM23_09390 [Acidobacteriota bacterium]
MMKFRRFAGVSALAFILLAVLGVVAVTAAARFTDVPTDHIFYAFVEAFFGEGITAGTSATTFSPDAAVTRGQMAVFMMKLRNLQAERQAMKVATLRWYEGTQNGNRVHLEAGYHPVSLAFDGDMMWVLGTSSTEARLYRFHTPQLDSDGLVYVTNSTGSSEVGGLAFDGKGVWFSYPSGIMFHLCRVGIVETTIAATQAAGRGPSAFDGENVWLYHQSSALLEQMRPADFVSRGTYAMPFPASSGDRAGLAFDGSHLWLSDGSSSSVLKIDLNGSVVGTYAVGNGAGGIAFDGHCLWVALSAGDSVAKIDRSGTVLGTYPVGDFPLGVCFDGSSIWVTNFLGNSVTKLRCSDGTVLKTFAMDSGPQAIAFDGLFVWVGCRFAGTVVAL